MKKILGFVILFGFVLMLGAAGSADASHISFLTLLLLELAGALTVLLGTSALMHYKRYLRRTILKKRLANSSSLSKKTPVGVKIRLIHKELC